MQPGTGQSKVLNAARPQFNAPVKRRPERIRPVPITSAAVQNSGLQGSAQEAGTSQPADQMQQSMATQMASNPTGAPAGTPGSSARGAFSDRGAGTGAATNSMVPDRSQRGGRGRSGPRGVRNFEGQMSGPPAPPSGSAGRSEGGGRRGGRGGRGNPAGYRQQQAQYQGMPAQSMAAQQMYYPVSSTMYYPPAAFGIPAATPGLPAISQEQLQLAVRQQIEYYFSIANLVKDVFLRSKMNQEGWISLHVIASFNRVRMLTPDLAIIMEALLDSAIVELSGDSLFIRPRAGYQQWILPESQRDASAHALPHMPGNTSSNSMKPAGQAQSGSAPSDSPATTAAGEEGDTDAPAASSGQAERTGSSKSEAGAGPAEEQGVQQAAPATPSNSKQPPSASSSPSPVEGGPDSQSGVQSGGQPQHHSKPAHAAEEGHAEEDMFEMDEVCCCSAGWLCLVLYALQLEQSCLGRAEGS